MGAGTDEVAHTELLAREDDVGEDGALASTDALLDLTAHGLTTDFGLEATLLTAVAEDLVVKDGDVPKLTREARLTEVDLLVLDDPEAEPPADVDVEDGVDFLVFGASGGELSEGHTARVVVDGDAQGELATQDLGERTVAEEVKEAIAMPRDGVDAPWEIDVDVEYLLGLDAVACDEGADLTAKSFESFGGVLEAVRYIVVCTDEVAL